MTGKNTNLFKQMSQQNGNQTEQSKKVSSLKELIETTNAKMTYAVIKGRNNVIITLSNRNGLIRINIVTALDQRFASGFRVDVLDRVIQALNDLNTELQAYKQSKPQNSNVKVY